MDACHSECASTVRIEPNIEKVPKERLVSTEGNEMRSKAEKVLAKPICLAREVGTERDIASKCLSEGGRDWIEGRDQTEELEVGSERVGKHEGVTSIVFGTGVGVAVAEAIELSRVEREHCDAGIEESIDYRVDGGLDGHRHFAELVVRMLSQPGDETSVAFDRVLDISLLTIAAAIEEQTDAVLFRGPIDADETTVRRFWNGHEQNLTKLVSGHALLLIGPRKKLKQLRL